MRSKTGPKTGHFKTREALAGPHAELAEMAGVAEKLPLDMPRREGYLPGRFERGLRCFKTGEPPVPAGQIL